MSIKSFLNKYFPLTKTIVINAADYEPTCEVDVFTDVHTSPKGSFYHARLIHTHYHNVNTGYPIKEIKTFGTWFRQQKLFCTNNSKDKESNSTIMEKPLNWLVPASNIKVMELDGLAKKAIDTFMLEQYRSKEADWYAFARRVMHHICNAGPHWFNAIQFIENPTNT